MRVLMGSDERTPLTDAVAGALREGGHELTLVGPVAGGEEEWADVGAEVGRRVAAGEGERGVLFCWTGTGVSIAANKVPGVRAALCGDAETAAGARTWNDANVLALSLRATSIPIAKAMLDAWFGAAPTTDPKYAAMIEQIQSADLPVNRT